MRATPLDPWLPRDLATAEDEVGEAEGSAVSRGGGTGAVEVLVVYLVGDFPWMDSIFLRIWIKVTKYITVYTKFMMGM